MPGNERDIHFLQWALPELGYRWEGFRKPRNQVLKRIRNRIMELQLSGGYSGYREYLENHKEEWAILDRLLDVTISKFYRDRQLWEFLRDKILSELFENIKYRPVSVWSAGCCNGEEPYSIAMINEQLKMSNSGGEEISILGTDRNKEVLKRAKKGCYPAGALKELNKDEINQYFHRIDDDQDDYCIVGRLSQQINFECRDIKNSLPEQQFDLVFCRNLVFTYFTGKNQCRFLNRLKPHLISGGYLVIGSNESIPDDTEWLRPVNNTQPVFEAS